MIHECDVRRSGIFREEHLLFTYIAYAVDDSGADMVRIAEDPETPERWAIREPTQAPVRGSGREEWWETIPAGFRLASWSTKPDRSSGGLHRSWCGGREATAEIFIGGIADIDIRLCRPAAPAMQDTEMRDGRRSDFDFLVLAMKTDEGLRADTFGFAGRGARVAGEIAASALKLFFLGRDPLYREKP